VVGCSKVSEGCANCYAERLVNGRLRHRYPDGFEAVRLHPDRLDQPLRWRKQRRVFVNSLSDLFHDQVPDEFIVRVFDVMITAHQHTFQVLTKRPGRMASFVRRYLAGAFTASSSRGPLTFGVEPPPNIWLGSSVEDQRWANVRIPKLLSVPAAVRFLSCEPLLGPVDLGTRLYPATCPSGCGCRCPDDADARECGCAGPCCTAAWNPAPGIDWVIVGGESGPGARAMDLAWAADLIEQCQDAGVAVFVKQLGSMWARSQNADPKGGDWAYWPPDLRIRQFPTAKEAA